jgi:hypothetical protein
VADGDLDRVEIVWLPRPLQPGLLPYILSTLRVQAAQQFAEDIWFYQRENENVVAVGLNHLDEVLETFGLELPAGLAGG